jgi:hypothetical protein
MKTATLDSDQVREGDSSPLVGHVVSAITSMLQTLPSGIQGQALRSAYERAQPAETREKSHEELYDEMVAESVGLEQEVLEADGGLVGSGEFARLLGMSSEETPRNYHRQGKVLAIRKGERALRFPAWQVHNGQLLPGLKKVIEVLNAKDADPLSQIIFFVYECDELEGARPLDLLRRGKVDEVVMAARRQWEMGR